MTKLKYLTTEELYEIELAARRARNAELARLIGVGAKAVKSLILRLVSAPVGHGKAVRHA
jgi:hypothetical protein